VLTNRPEGRSDYFFFLAAGFFFAAVAFFAGAFFFAGIVTSLTRVEWKHVVASPKISQQHSNKHIT
jgi:hypothetical protein